MSNHFFITLQTCVFIDFMVKDIFFSNIDSKYIKYLGIIYCLLYCLINRKKFAILSFSFTLLADYFLLIRNNNYPIGIFFFIIVQIIYAIYLYKNECKLFLIYRILIPLVLILILRTNDLTTTLALIYFPQLVLNALSSLKNKNQRLLSLGLILFIGCDICVGLHNIYEYNKLIAIGQWLFYLPSQVLIALSIYNNDKL